MSLSPVARKLLPQEQVMPHASAMFHRGSFGTTFLGLSAALSMVMLPPVRHRSAREQVADEIRGLPDAAESLSVLRGFSEVH